MRVLGVRVRMRDVHGLPEIRLSCKLSAASFVRWPSSVGR